MIIVCCLRDMARCAAESGATHIVSMIEPDYLPDTPGGFPPVRHLKIAVDDITRPVDGMILPREDHVAEFIDFVADWQREHPIVVHCHAGVSRSMAAALTLLCLDASENETAMARRLRRRAPRANPNRLIVALADRLLGRQGRMVEALDAMGPARLVWEGPVTRVPLRAD